MLSSAPKVLSPQNPEEREPRSRGGEGGERRSPSLAHSMYRNSGPPLLGEGEALAHWRGAQGPVSNPDETHSVIRNKRHEGGRGLAGKRRVMGKSG